MTKTRVIVLVVAVALATLWYRHSRHTAQAPRPADGVLVGATPRWGAASIGKHATYMALGRNEALPTGALDITGRVLARKLYPAEGFGDQIKLDLVLGWGPMSDNRVLDQLAIVQERRTLRIDPGSAPVPGDAYDSVINVSVYSDYDPSQAHLESIRVGDVIRMVGWTLRLRNPQGATWDGGTGNDRSARRSVVLSVHKLQINDQKKYGNWDTETNYFPPQ